MTEIKRPTTAELLLRRKEVRALARKAADEISDVIADRLKHVDDTLQSQVLSMVQNEIEVAIQKTRV